MIPSLGSMIPSLGSMIPSFSSKRKLVAGTPFQLKAKAADRRLCMLFASTFYFFNVHLCRTSFPGCFRLNESCLTSGVGLVACKTIKCQCTSLALSNQKPMFFFLRSQTTKSQSCKNGWTETRPATGGPSFPTCVQVFGFQSVAEVTFETAAVLVKESKAGFG